MSDTFSTYGPPVNREFNLEQTDLVLQGRTSIVIRRAYHSQDPGSPPARHLRGHCWTLHLRLAAGLAVRGQAVQSQEPTPWPTPWRQLATEVL
ncbi:MAG: hypothetical protein OEY77_09935 [Nitrospira sp.]|nr:hypothetical protein [Nitrospira sp.]